MKDIKEAKKSHIESMEDLRIKHDLMQAVFEGTDDVVFVMDLQGRYKLMNSVGAKYLNRPLKEIIGKTNSELFPPETAQKIMEGNQKVLSSGKAMEFEVPIKIKGSTFIFYTKKAPYRDGKGNIIGVVGITRDITEHKKMEAELRKSEKSLRHAQQISHIGSWEWDVVTNESFCSDELYRIHGLKPQQYNITFESFLEQVHPEDREFVKKSINAALYERKPYSIEFRIVHPDGMVRIVHSEAKILFDKAGKPIRMVGTEQDITERKKVEEEMKELNETLEQRIVDRTEQLRSSNEKFRKLTSSVPDAIIMMDDEGKITFWNDASEKMFKYSIKEAVGRYLYELVIPVRLRKSFLNGFKRFQHTGHGSYVGKTAELIAIKKDGTEFSIEHSISAVKIKGKWNAIGIIRDITERKIAEERLKNSEDNYKSIWNNVNDAICVHDIKAGRILDVNLKMVELMGYLPEEIKNMNVGDFSIGEPPYTQEESLQWIKKAVEKGPQLFDWQVKDKTGRVFWVEVNLKKAVINNQDRVLAVVREITKRKKTEKVLKIRTRQQETVAHLGLKVLKGGDLTAIMNEAVEAIAKTLNNEFCKVLELLPDGENLLLRAGAGWKEGLVEKATVCTGLDSQAGYTLQSDEPIVVDDLRTEKRFSGPHLLHDHGVVSGMSVIIQGQKGPWGVLGTHSTQHKVFSKDDINFLQAVANLLADAIAGKQAEKKLHESELQYRSIFEQAAVGIIHVDLNGKFIKANKRSCKITGYTESEILELTFRDITHPDDIIKQEKLRKKILDGNASGYKVEKRYIRKTGHTIWADLTVALVCKPDGRPDYVISVVEDITARKNMKEVLVASEKQQRQMLDSLIEGVYQCEPEVEGVFTWVNQACAEIFGFKSRKEMVGIKAMDIYVDPDDRKRLVEKLEKYGIWRNFTSLCKKKSDEYFYAECTSNLVLDEKGNPIRIEGVVRDITERKIMEKQLIQAEKMSALGTTIAGIAHDINNPIGVIYLYSTESRRLFERFVSVHKHLNTLLHSFPEQVLHLKEAAGLNKNHKKLVQLNRSLDKAEPYLKEYLEGLVKESIRCKELVGDLLDFSKQKEPEIVLSNINDLIDNVFETAKKQYKEEEFKMVQKLGSNLPDIMIDVIQIEQVLINLLHNAALAMSETLEDRDHAGVNGKGVLTVGSCFHANKESVEIFVEDTGSGIHKDVLEKIFDPFFSVRKEGKGTGLGLSICYSIVKLHGGKIEVESKVGKGSTFRVFLPVKVRQ